APSSCLADVSARKRRQQLPSGRSERRSWTTGGRVMRLRRPRGCQCHGSRTRRFDLHVHACHYALMRTTVEITDEQRVELLRLAAQRGEKGFSGLVREAIARYLEAEASREDLVQAA